MSLNLDKSLIKGLIQGVNKGYIYLETNSKRSCFDLSRHFHNHLAEI